MGPIIVVDKSVIQALNPEEIWYLHSFYSVLITPILIQEILTNLTKHPDDPALSQEKVGRLAKKTDGFESHVAPSSRKVAMASLAGQDIPLDGRIPRFDGELLQSRDGRTSLFFDEQPEKEVLRRWSSENFQPGESEKAINIQNQIAAVDLNSLAAELKVQMKDFPSFKSLDDASRWLDTEFYPKKDQWALVLWTCRNALNMKEYGILNVAERWATGNFSSFEKFAAYGFYYFRLYHLYLVGLGCGLIKPGKGAKTNLDLEYLSYLPFSMGMASGDNFHAAMFRCLARPDQSFLALPELKKDLARIAGHLKETKQYPKAERYPPELEGSLTGEVWDKTMVPRERLRESQNKKHTKEEEAELLADLRRLTEDCVRVSDGKPPRKPDYKNEMEGVGLWERNMHLIEVANAAFGLAGVSDWTDLQKTVSLDQIKQFHFLYSEIWRPDTDIDVLLPNSEKAFRCLYQGDITPQTVIKDVIPATLYFDQVFIIDPFLNPWHMKHEYNPLKHPNYYVEDTLSLVFCLTSLSPWIEIGAIQFVPDLPKWNPDLMRESAKLAKARLAGWKAKGVIKEKGADAHREMMMRLACRVPKEQLDSFLRSAFPGITLDEIPIFRKAIEHWHEVDPGAVLSNVGGKAGHVRISRSGANLEVLLAVCERCALIPFSPDRMNKGGLAQLSKGRQMGKHKAAALLRMVESMELRMLYTSDLLLLKELRRMMLFVEFRKMASELIALLTEDDIDAGQLTEITERTREIREIFKDIFLAKSKKLPIKSENKVLAGDKVRLTFLPAGVKPPISLKHDLGHPTEPIRATATVNKAGTWHPLN